MGDALVPEPEQVVEHESVPWCSSMSTLSASAPRTVRPTSTSGTSAAAATMSADGMRGLTRISPSTRYSSSAARAERSRADLAPAGAEQQLVAELGGQLLDAAGDLGEERVTQVVEEHSDRAGACAGQPAGHRVGPVAEPRGGLEHARAPRRTDIGLLAHDERDERP